MEAKYAIKASPPAREAWIEIELVSGDTIAERVASREGGVD